MAAAAEGRAVGFDISQRVFRDRAPRNSGGRAPFRARTGVVPAVLPSTPLDADKRSRDCPLLADEGMSPTVQGRGGQGRWCRTRFMTPGRRKLGFAVRGRRLGTICMSTYVRVSVFSAYPVTAGAVILVATRSSEIASMCSSAASMPATSSRASSAVMASAG